MADREKLIELLDDIQRCGEDYTDCEIYGMRIPDTVSNEVVTDHLIANGVTVRERGRWIQLGKLDEDGNGQYYCSVCSAGETHNPIVDVPYCWKCGADMRGEEDGK